MQMRAIHKKRKHGGGSPGRRPRGGSPGPAPPARSAPELRVPLGSAPLGPGPRRSPGTRAPRLGSAREGAQALLGRRQWNGKSIVPAGGASIAPCLSARLLPGRSPLPTDTLGAALPPHRHGRGRHRIIHKNQPEQTPTSQIGTLRLRDRSNQL